MSAAAVCLNCNKPLPPSIIASSTSQVIRCDGCGSLLLWAAGRVVRAIRQADKPGEPQVAGSQSEGSTSEGRDPKAPPGHRPTPIERPLGGRSSAMAQPIAARPAAGPPPLPRPGAAPAVSIAGRADTPPGGHRSSQPTRASVAAVASGPARADASFGSEVTAPGTPPAPHGGAVDAGWHLGDEEVTAAPPIPPARAVTDPALAVAARAGLISPAGAIPAAERDAIDSGWGDHDAAAGEETANRGPIPGSAPIALALDNHAPARRNRPVSFTPEPSVRGFKPSSLVPDSSPNWAAAANEALAMEAAENGAPEPQSKAVQEAVAVVPQPAPIEPVVAMAAPPHVEPTAATPVTTTSPVATSATDREVTRVAPIAPAPSQPAGRAAAQGEVVRAPARRRGVLLAAAAGVVVIAIVLLFALRDGAPAVMEPVVAANVADTAVPQLPKRSEKEDPAVAAGGEAVAPPAGNPAVIAAAAEPHAKNAAIEKAKADQVSAAEARVAAAAQARQAVEAKRQAEVARAEQARQAKAEQLAAAVRQREEAKQARAEQLAAARAARVEKIRAAKASRAEKLAAANAARAEKLAAMKAARAQKFAAVKGARQKQRAGAKVASAQPAPAKRKRGPHAKKHRAAVAAAAQSDVPQAAAPRERKRPAKIVLDYDKPARHPGGKRHRRGHKPLAAAVTPAPAAVEAAPSPGPAAAPELTPAEKEAQAVAQARTTYREGSVKLFSGDFSTAEAAYQKSLMEFPGYVAAYRGLGLVYAKQDKPKEALDAWSTYLELVPNAKDAWLVKRRMARVRRLHPEIPAAAPQKG